MVIETPQWTFKASIAKSTTFDGNEDKSLAHFGGKNGKK